MLLVGLARGVGRVDELLAVLDHLVVDVVRDQVPSEDEHEHEHDSDEQDCREQVVDELEHDGSLR